MAHEASFAKRPKNKANATEQFFKNGDPTFSIKVCGFLMDMVIILVIIQVGMNQHVDKHYSVITISGYKYSDYHWLFSSVYDYKSTDG